MMRLKIAFTSIFVLCIVACFCSDMGPGIHISLHEAVATNNTALTRDLLAHGVNVNAKNAEGQTPLHVAIEYEYVEVLRELLAANADVNATDNENRTPLHSVLDCDIAEREEAIVSINLALIRTLLSAGADVHVQDNRGSTPLHFAAMNGNHNAVALLLQHGADVNAIDIIGRTPLHEAVFLRHMATIEALVTNPLITVNAKDCKGETSLHLASYDCDKDEIEIVRLLLDSGADVAAQNNKGATALDKAAECADSEVIALLTEAAAQTKRWTPLRAAWVGANVRASIQRREAAQAAAASAGGGSAGPGDAPRKRKARRKE